jgi:hypothetical protein
MQSSVLLDRAGRRRSPAALPGYHQGRPPRNKELRYPPDPPTEGVPLVVIHASSDAPTSAPPRTTSAASTTPKSSTMSRASTLVHMAVEVVRFRN